MILVMVALVELVNILLAMLPTSEPVTLQGVLGLLLSPVAWLIGIPWDQAAEAGKLLGTKTVINEFVAYLDLAALDAAALGESQRTTMTYALCGFANPGSLGILVGGLAAMAPSRKREIIELAWRSIIAGTLATCMTGAVANLFISTW
jgi:CNT family concentrative nucleoside transporter